MFKKILPYGFIEGIAKGLNKATLLLLPLFITTVDFGKVGLLVSLELLLPFLTLLGFERVILRFYHSPERPDGIIKTIFQSVLFSHIVVLLFVFIVQLWGIKEIFGLSIFPDIFLLIILVYLQGRNQIILSIYRVEENHQAYFKSRLILQIGKFILVIGLIYFTKSYLAYLIGGILSSLFINLYSRVPQNSENFNRETLNRFLMFSSPFILHGIAVSLLDNADKLILEQSLNTTSVGLYTFAYSIGSMMIFGYVGIAVYMEPFLYKSKDIYEFEIRVKSFLNYALCLGILSLTGIYLISNFVLPLMYKKYLLAMPYIPFLAVAYILYPYYLSSNYRLIYNQNTKIIAALSLTICLINIALNVLLIPSYGLWGATGATIISYVLQAILFSIVSNKKIATELVYILMLAIIIIGAVCWASNILLLILVLISVTGIFFAQKKT